jgi:hypothetical protein
MNLFGVGKKKNNGIVQVMEGAQYGDSPKLEFQDARALLLVGQWLNILKNTKVIMSSGMELHTSLSLDEMLQNTTSSREELTEIIEKMSGIFKQMGFTKADTIAISNGSESDFSFDICLNEQDEKSKVSMEFGDWLDYPPMITVDSAKSTKVYFCNDKDGVRTLSLSSETDKRLEAAGYAYHHSTFDTMSDYAVLEGNGFKLKVNIAYPESTWNYALKANEPMEKYFDMVGLSKALSTVSLPVKAVSFFEMCSGLSLAGRDELRELSIAQSAISISASGEIIEKETDYIEAANKRFMLTEGTESVSLNVDGSWEYSSNALLYQHSVTQASDGCITLTSKLSSQGDVTAMPSQADIYQDACSEVENVKAKRSDIFKGK